MTVANDHLDAIRGQVREHLSRAERGQPDEEQRRVLRERVKGLLERENAVLVAHYYTAPDIQALAEDTGGIVSDSLEMARFGHDHKATTLIVAGVKFMGETAKILTPAKRVLMPTLEATCSLDIGCPIEEFSTFCDQNPDRQVVVYANTSAAVKARADWVVTSSIALAVAEHLHSRGERILWAPDRHLGDYVQRQTGADIIMWDGACIVHEEFKARGVADLKAVYPEAAVLVHPSPPQRSSTWRTGSAPPPRSSAPPRRCPTGSSSSPPIRASSTRCSSLRRTRNSSSRPLPGTAPPV